MASVNEQASTTVIAGVIVRSIEITAHEAAETPKRKWSGLWPRAHVVGFSVAFAFFAITAASWGQVTTSAGPSSPAHIKATPSVATLLRFEPTGLSLLKPYERGKIPVILIHGLWSSPWSWARMVDVLESDVALARSLSVLDLRLFDRRPASVLGRAAATRPGRGAAEVRP